MKVSGLCGGGKRVSKERIRLVCGRKNLLSKHVCLEFLYEVKIIKSRRC